MRQCAVFLEEHNVEEQPEAYREQRVVQDGRDFIFGQAGYETGSHSAHSGDGAGIDRSKQFNLGWRLGLPNQLCLRREAHGLEPVIIQASHDVVPHLLVGHERGLLLALEE